MVNNSVGIVTALLPVIGYKNSSAVAKKAIHDGTSVIQEVVDAGHLTHEQVTELLRPEKLTRNDAAARSPPSASASASASSAADVAAGSRTQPPGSISVQLDVTGGAGYDEQYRDLANTQSRRS